MIYEKYGVYLSLFPIKQYNYPIILLPQYAFKGVWDLEIMKEKLRWKPIKYQGSYLSDNGNPITNTGVIPNKPLWMQPINYDHK